MSSSHFSALTVLACLVLNLAACGESHEEKSKREESVRQEKQGRIEAQRAQITAELRATFNADDGWDKGTIAWTVELQGRLIRSDGRPIIAVARLRDVEKSGETFLVDLIPNSSFDSPAVEFVLKCPRPNIKAGAVPRWLSSDSSYPQVIFVAKIHKLRKYEGVSVEMDELSHDVSLLDRRLQWIAEGECLALRELRQK